MKNFKSIMCILLVCLLSVFVLVACGGNGGDNGKDAHTHTAGDEWSFDPTNHWKVCSEDGEKVEVAAHTFEQEICSVCKVKVTESDGKADVYVLNEKGNWTVCYHYEGDKKVSEDTMEYKYFADGNVEAMTMKTNGKLSYEAEYAVDESGYNEIVTQIRNKEFEKELTAREKAFETEKQLALQTANAENEKIIEKLAKTLLIKSDKSVNGCNACV